MCYKWKGFLSDISYTHFASISFVFTFANVFTSHQAYLIIIIHLQTKDNC